MPLIRKTFLHIALIVWILMISGCSKPVSDDDLIKLLSEHRKQFVELTKLTKQCVSSGEPILWDHSDNAKSSACVKIMKSIGIHGISLRENGSVYFYVDNDNYSGDEKGLVFSTRQLSPLLNSLDEPPSDLQPYREIYRRVDNNWYIYFLRS